MTFKALTGANIAGIIAKYLAMSFASENVVSAPRVISNCLRIGLQTRLQQESCLQVIAEAEDRGTAVELTQEHLPNVVVIDVGLPGIGALKRAAQLNSGIQKFQF
jgi:CheY-like chemotaxis protein